MIRSDFHTHTSFCDGKNTPEEMVRAALCKGMNAIGFSGHSYSRYESYGMKPEICREYCEEILRLKKVYSGQIDIFLGLEQDSSCPAPDYPFDYLIGSVHGLLKNGKYISIDESEESMVKAVREEYDGDYFAYTSDYYRTLSDSVGKFHPDIIGHFDLVTKFNESSKYFDESDPRYRSSALSALEKIMKTNRCFEINTGAVSRGYRSSPYPAPFLIKAIYDMGGQIVLSSDAHSADGLLFSFDTAADLARECGFRTALILTPNGWKESAL